MQSEKASSRPAPKAETTRETSEFIEKLNNFFDVLFIREFILDERYSLCGKEWKIRLYNEP